MEICLLLPGSPGSGKTTLAVKLAAEIAPKKKKNVIVVCSDPFCAVRAVPASYGYGAGRFHWVRF